MPKRALEKKVREEQEATAHAFQEFIKAFQDYSGPPNKTFVKSSILNAKTGQEIESQKGEIYNPKPFLKHQTDTTVKNAIECARLIKVSQVKHSKCQEKPKTNLQLLKEELKLRHMERDEKNKHKKGDPSLYSSFDSTDPTTTNLFIANINQKVTEQNLMNLFGAYGPLASVKIMWPRGDEKNRTTNCGFVAFMSRKDGQRALNDLKDRDDMRVGWGRPVELPENPIYIPPELVKLSLPPPYSGLPFNAQPFGTLYEYPRTPQELDKVLYNSYVKVTIPLDKKILMIIHRTIEFVVNEGPLFEAILMNREINNSSYQFLFDNKNPIHVYYRWKLYSILHGESQKTWSINPFRMFKAGSIWIPPVIPNYCDGMPEILLNVNKTVDRNILSEAQRTRFIRLIQNLTVNRIKVGEAMVFCLNHKDTVIDIVDIIADSFVNISTKPPKKLARLYLISDLINNSNMKRSYSATYSKELQKHLLDIFQHLHTTLKYLNSTVDKDIFQSKVLNVIKSWNFYKSYDCEYLEKLEFTFLGLAIENNVTDDDCDTDEPLDGSNLIKRSLNTSSEYVAMPHINEHLKPAADIQQPKLGLPAPGFIPSRWETVDPEQVEAQAMSTKKIYDLQMESHLHKDKVECEPKQLSKYDRDVLRKVEVMVMQYQDDLESGKCKIKNNVPLEKEVSRYRNVLIETINTHKSTDDTRQKNKRGSHLKIDGETIEKLFKKKKHKKRNSRNGSGERIKCYK